MGKDWHPNCFKCTQCKIPLDPENFYEKNGKPYCEKDFHNLFSPKCAGCIKPIKGTVRYLYRILVFSFRNLLLDLTLDFIST